MIEILIISTDHTIPLPLRSTPTNVGDGSGSGSKDPELKKHLEAAKRAASAIFAGIGG